MVKALYDGRLAVDIAGLKMATPVNTGSGTFGFGWNLPIFSTWKRLALLP